MNLMFFPFNQVDFLASFGGVTTTGKTMMGGHLQGRHTAVGSRGPYGRLQGSKSLKQSWLDPNFSTSSDLSCTSVMVRGFPREACSSQIMHNQPKRQQILGWKSCLGFPDYAQFGQIQPNCVAFIQIERLTCALCDDTHLTRS